MAKLQTLSDLPSVGDVRGTGLMLAVEFVQDKKLHTPYPAGTKFSARVAEYCLQNGVIVTAGLEGAADGICGDAMQIAPPFIITEEEMDIVVDTLRKGIITVADSL